MKPPARANERQSILEHIEKKICLALLLDGDCRHPFCSQLLDLYLDIESGAHLVK